VSGRGRNYRGGLSFHPRSTVAREDRRIREQRTWARPDACGASMGPRPFGRGNERNITCPAAPAEPKISLTCSRDAHASASRSAHARTSPLTEAAGQVKHTERWVPHKPVLHGMAAAECVPRRAEESSCLCIPRCIYSVSIHGQPPAARQRTPAPFRARITALTRRAESPSQHHRGAPRVSLV
jgi:hypothetical protein